MSAVWELWKAQRPLSPSSFYYALSHNYRAGVRTLSVVGPEIVTRLRGAVHGKGQIGEPAYKRPSV
jgi:hypothetical protein